MKIKNQIKLIVTFVLVLTLFSTTIVLADTNEVSAISLDENSTVYTTDNYIDTQTYTEDDPTTEEVYSITEKDLFLFNDQVDINYLVSGNVYIIAQDVTIDSVIDGNVFILANNVTFGENAYIYSDVFVVANTLKISGYLYDLYSMSSSLDITDSGFIIRDMNSACSSFTLNGTVKRNANLTAGTISINSETASIGGNLNYTSNNEVSLSDGIVSGEVTFSKTETVEITTTDVILTYVKNLVKTLIYALIILLIIVLINAKTTINSDGLLTTKLGAVLGYGILGLILIPLICIILCFTGIGLWLALFGLFAYIFALSIAEIVLSVELGKIICNKFNINSKPLLVFISILIIIALWILSNIPVIGGIISMVAVVIGLGLILYTIFHLKGLKKEAPIEVVKPTVAEKDVQNQNKENEQKNNNE